jgi:predicted ribosome quality control (RQC) complex YloA/Tae2 family protein
LRFNFNNFIVYCGRNAYQNQLVTFTIGESQDLWMHARGMPGGHVIIKTQGRSVPDSVMLLAASLAAYHSKSRHEKAVDIDYCRRSSVRKVKGDPPGLVTCTAEGTLRVAPNKIS